MGDSAARSTLSSLRADRPEDPSEVLPEGLEVAPLEAGSVLRIEEGGRKGDSELSFTREKRNLKYCLSSRRFSCRAANA